MAMTPKQDFAELMRVVAVSAGISLFSGLAMAVMIRPPMSFGTALVGYTFMIGSFFVAFPLGENLDLERRRGKKRWDMILVISVCACSLAIGGYFVGLGVPPLIGQSENHLLFPAFVLIGILGGALGNQERFRRK
jgi:Na+/glutamate symporter